MSKVELVIPIGPGDPQQDIPTKELLYFGLNDVRRSTKEVFLTCAIDENLPINKQNIVRDIADKVVMFPPHSYYAKGGIWNKIYTCWEQSDADYVAWNGYDDYSSADRFELQSKTLDDTGANACFCKQAMTRNDIITLTNSGNLDWLKALGQHALYMGGFLLRRKAILDSGLGEHRHKWPYYFEGLLYAYILKTGRPVVSDGTFFYHDHGGTISHTAREERDWVKEARAITRYTLEETEADWASIDLSRICQEIRVNWK